MYDIVKNHKQVQTFSKLYQFSSVQINCSVVSNSSRPCGLCVARQAPLSMEHLSKGYRSGWPFPSQGIFPTQGSNPGLLPCRWDSLPSEPPGKPELRGSC